MFHHQFHEFPAKWPVPGRCRRTCGWWSIRLREGKNSFWRDSSDSPMPLSRTGTMRADPSPAPSRPDKFNSHFTVLGEFDGVGHEIQQHCPQACGSPRKVSGISGATDQSV